MVLFQSMHNLSYAEGVCSFVTSAPGETFASSEAKSQCASQTDAQFFGRRLEQDVQSKFAANPNCSGVTIIKGWYSKYDGGDGHEYLAAQAQDHWDLLLDFEPGSEKHWWSLFPAHGYKEPEVNRGILGEGTPGEIADAVCISVKKTGATR